MYRDIIILFGIVIGKFNFNVTLEKKIITTFVLKLPSVQFKSTLKI